MGEQKHAITVSEVEKGDTETPVQYTTPVSPLKENEITRIPTEATLHPKKAISPQSTYHIYEETPLDKCISPVIDPKRERWSGPSLKEQKIKRLQKKERESSGLPPVEPDDAAFYMHQPYLSFHLPPQVLYMGNSKYTAKPAVIMHEGCFWKKYTLQLGPSISQPGVIDPRGVVAWRHNGGDKKALKADRHKLKGYKVRGWRLWGETGKAYVHAVKANRVAGKGPDPDVFDSKSVNPAVAEEVVCLRWMSPLSRHTRCYHFRYMGIDFYWKGTASVRESRACGLLLRFNHLKLVARLPIVDDKKHEEDELCLGRYTCSIACKKSGTLEFFDATILHLIDEYGPSMLDLGSVEEQSEGDAEAERALRLRKSRLYQVFVATAMCMIKSEKEKRHTLMELILGVAEGGGGAA
ncbi:uncharacterized protein yc1106_09011 [Curvularia clavata]|uniref:Uncharacterized protein n=1 Tax=Curvularia clavata TaxID=95742 RepID=A0A9Q8ZGV9_CURCL|nr:uncharacterized protein yc1106_09011 [Curvularia clavata]